MFSETKKKNGERQIPLASKQIRLGRGRKRLGIDEDESTREGHDYLAEGR